MDTRDGLKKWDVDTGSSINGTPSIFGNNIAIGTDSGSMNIYNKFTGDSVWSYNPGYLPNISGGITSSPVTSGGSLFFATEDGHVYSLNTDQQIGPTSVYTYYWIIVAAIIVKAAYGINKVYKRKNN